MHIKKFDIHVQNETCVDGNIGVARGGQGRAFARPSLIFALPLKSYQRK